jgi:uncharacterized UBP type Zn finger protein
MENYIIIRAVVNGGKTTTCGVLYEELSKKAEFSRLYNYQFEEIDSLIYNNGGELTDFIAVIILDGKIIVIVSQGDIAKWLEVILDKLSDENLIKRITGNFSTKVDFYVLCARSIAKTNSTIEMLYNRIPANQRKAFWTTKSQDEKDKKTIKLEIVGKIIAHIEN